MAAYTYLRRASDATRGQISSPFATLSSFVPSLPPLTASEAEYVLVNTYCSCAAAIIWLHTKNDGLTTAHSGSFERRSAQSLSSNVGKSAALDFLASADLSGNIQLRCVPSVRCSGRAFTLAQCVRELYRSSDISFGYPSSAQSYRTFLLCVLTHSQTHTHTESHMQLLTLA